MRPRANSRCLLVLTVGALFACTSRTLPLPPPEVSQVSPPDADGYVTVEGRAREGASVAVLNDATLEGTIVTSQEVGCSSSCAFQARLLADSGDPLRVWQFFETDTAIESVVP